MPNDTLFLFSNDSTILIGKSQKSLVIIHPTSKDEGDSFLGVNKDYASLILIPILSFFLALLFNLIREKLKIKAKLRLNQNFLFTWVELIGGQIAKQKQLLYDFSQSIALDGTQLVPFRRIDLHIEKFRLIQSYELTQLFVTDRKGSEVRKNKLLFDWENNISLLERKVKNIEDHFDNFKEFYKTKVAEWNEEMVQFNDAYTIFMQSEISHESTTTNVNVGKINELYKAWIFGNNFSQKNTVESLLIPMDEWCKKFITQFPKNTQIVALRKSITLLRTTHLHQNTTNDYYATNFKSFSDELQTGYENIVETKKQFNTIKFKFLLNLK